MHFLFLYFVLLKSVLILLYQGFSNPPVSLCLSETPVLLSGKVLDQPAISYPGRSLTSHPYFPSP